MANNKNKVLIAGGGIGGITALLALRQRGIDAELFEIGRASCRERVCAIV